MNRERLKIGNVPAIPGRRAVSSFERDTRRPLNLAGEDASAIDRREVNLRWLCASALTGITGAALFIAAIHVSLQSEVSFAAIPERASLVVQPQASESGVNSVGKSDRLVRNLMIASAKQNFRTPVTVRLGDREIIKVKPFVRLSTALSMSTGLYAADIARFDPMKISSDDSQDYVSDPGADEDPGGEFSVVKLDLLGQPMDASAPALSDDDMAAQVEEDRRLSAVTGQRTSLPIAPQMMLTRTLQAPAPAEFGSEIGKESSPFKSIDVLVVPENVTRLDKVALAANEAPIVEERDMALKRGETLESQLRASKLAGDSTIRGIVAALGGRGKVASLPEGQQYRVQFAPGPRQADNRQVTRVVLYGETGVEAIAALNDRGSFVSVTPPVDGTRASDPKKKAAESEDDEGGTGPRLFQSLYETAARHELPRSSVDDIIRVFSYDIDFQRRIAAGDGLDVFYTYDEDAGPSSGEKLELLFAALKLGGDSHKIYRFQSPDDGSVDFLDEEGRSLKKFLIRKPIADGIMRSGFGYRRHPILGYAKMHTGVDWANPIGTPIVAAGNGQIIKAEWDSGYGRRVEIQHINGYVTTYNHMSRFARGVAQGARARQGQVIGYVGSTGLSTGPHLHYEVVINGRFVDPMKIRVPRGRELDGKMLAEFKRQRDQIDTTMEKSKVASNQPQREATR